MEKITNLDKVTEEKDDLILSALVQSKNELNDIAD